MYEDLRNAVEVIKNYCADREFCWNCPLNHVICNVGYLHPNAYSLKRFDENVKEFEKDNG